MTYAPAKIYRPGLSHVRRLAMASTTERGYGAAHQRERERWRPIVDAGEAHCAQPVCLMPSRWIEPGTRWALGHNDDRTAWIGPTHERCNLIDGASKGGRIANAQRGRYQLRRIASRDW